MAERLPFNKRDRHRWAQSGIGFRPRNDWGEGDLPAPWAEGDIVFLAEGADMERLYDMHPGRHYVISYATSVDEGDAWYFRVTDGIEGHSDRLHVGYADRSEWDEDVDWMSRFTLVDTADPAGLAKRERLLAEGWSYEKAQRCPTCGRMVFHRCAPASPPVPSPPKEPRADA